MRRGRRCALRCRAPRCLPGPLRQPAGRAGVGGTEHFQRDITRQREQVAFEAFSRDVGALPDEHPALRSWLEVGSFAQALITSWPSVTTGVDVGFEDCFAHYLGCWLPYLIDLHGQPVPDSHASRRAPPRGQGPPPCDPYGLALETATLPGGHQTDRSDAIRDVIAGDLPGSATEVGTLFRHVLPQSVYGAARCGVRPDIVARTAHGQPPGRRQAAAPLRAQVLFDVKQLTGGAGLYRIGPHARSRQRAAPLAERARQVHGDYESAARSLDIEHSRRADGSRYPPARQQREQHLVGPVLAALRAYPPVVGLVVGSYQGTSASVEALAREAAEARASASWRLMGARSESEAVGIFMQDVYRRWGSCFWRTWVRCIRGRRPCVGLGSAAVLQRGPEPPAPRGVAAQGGGEEVWPLAGPDFLRGEAAAAGVVPGVGWE